MDDVEVAVIGGGITGLGTARDLAMRGVDVVLVERGPLGAETSTHFHGLLHSGARYAVENPVSAERCMKENRVLRSIGPDYVEFTRGYLIKLGKDSEEYYQRKIEACERCDIPVEEVDREELLDKMPVLSDRVERAIRVPDGVIDPVGMIWANAESAKKYGCEIRTGTEVTDLVIGGGAVKGLELKNEDNENTLCVDFVINATGPWAKEVGNKGGLDVDLRPTKGVMTAVENPGINRVINRCRPPNDGDIIVPYGETAIIGTTSERVKDPDEFKKTREETEAMIEEGSSMVPSISESEVHGSYWGVRPLYGSSKEGRSASREFGLIDHEETDEIENILTVVGGKWTTYRYMAEKTADLVCRKLGVEARCETHERGLPDPSDLPQRDWPPL